MTPAPPAGYPIFNTPPELATAIRQTGWRACSTAAPHPGPRATRGRWHDPRAGPGRGGPHRLVLLGGRPDNAADHDGQRRPRRVPGLHRAHQRDPLAAPWSANRASAAQILSDANAPAPAAPKSSSSISTGAMRMSPAQPLSARARRPAQPLTQITAIVGQHVHIVQPIRIINGKLVVFGEGNLISNQTSACCPAASQDGMIVLLTITVDSRGARVARDPLRAGLGPSPGLRGAPGRGRVAHRSCRRRRPARHL